MAWNTVISNRLFQGHVDFEWPFGGWDLTFVPFSRKTPIWTRWLICGGGFSWDFRDLYFGIGFHAYTWRFVVELGWIAFWIDLNRDAEVERVWRS